MKARFPNPALARAAARRGSVLIVALLVAALIALVLGSYLSLNLGTARLAQRTFDRGAAFHLAEAGLEEGLWTYNRLLADDPEAWQGWSLDGDAAWRGIEGFRLSGTTSGSIKIYASPIAPAGDTAPILVALATIKSPGGAPVTQMIETTLRRRSFFSAGLVALEHLAFRGRNSTFDSWDSDPDRDPATPAIPYAQAVPDDDGHIATGADPANLSLNHARIHGYFITDGFAPEVGSTGHIGSYAVAEGEIEPSRLSQRFHAQFPDVDPPAGGSTIHTFGRTLGTVGEATLTILGDVTLVLTDPLSAITLAGQAALIIPPGSSLTLYAAGDCDFSGQGIANPNGVPITLQLWSTAPPERAQTIRIVGQGGFCGLIYAPRAQVTVNGNGSVAGSIVARDLTFTGNAAFHYDHALGRLGRHAPFRSDGWRTLDTAADRSAWLPLVDR